jgi:gas vesicle protein
MWKEINMPKNKSIDHLINLIKKQQKSTETTENVKDVFEEFIEHYNTNLNIINETFQAMAENIKELTEKLTELEKNRK